MTAAGSGVSLRQPYDWKSDPAGGKGVEIDRLTEIKRGYAREQGQIETRRGQIAWQIKQLEKERDQLQPQWDELEQRICNVLRVQMKTSALIWLGADHRWSGPKEIPPLEAL